MAVVAGALGLLLGACGGGPNALRAAGPGAERIAALWWVMLGVGTAVFVLVVALLGVALFRRRREPPADPPLGVNRGADSHVGPPLDAWSRRAFIAGRHPNRPDTLVRWIMDPESLSPGTAMPNLGVSEPQARDIAAYLYSLD